jgi:hypothetical protein
MTPPRLTVHAARFGIRHIPMRLPFRFGMTTLTSSAQIHLFLDVEVDGTRVTGLAADMLAPKWYDKDPDKSYADNLNDLVAGAQLAADTAVAVDEALPLFDLWRRVYDACQVAGPAAGRNPLVAGNGPSLVERALFDALGLALDTPYHSLLVDNLAGIDLAQVHEGLAGLSPADVLPAAPRQRIDLRHTVGMADPIHTADITAEARLDDGLPQSLEEYIEVQGLRHFKIKVGGDVDADAARLEEIARALPAGELFVSLDGNEQYNEPADLARLLDAIEQGSAASRRLYEAIRYLEQPLDRRVVFDGDAQHTVRDLSERKPMVIDESDEELRTFRDSVDLGYRGVSSKACKGLIKALANQAWCHRLNDEAGQERYFLTGEDLTNVGVVALNQDLAHLAALGVTHAERNGHHYVRGLDYLPAAEREAALAEHAGLYERRSDGLVALQVTQGVMDVSSLQRPGLGVGAPPDAEQTIALAGWTPEELEGAGG